MSYARKIADAGADAIELNLYEVVADVDATADQIESAQLTLVEQVRDSVAIPLAVKVGPYYTAFAGMARRLVDAGADALVLFNRFYQPDIDPDTLRVRPWLELSRRAEIRLPLRWRAILSGQVGASLALTGGVHSSADVARGLLAGADVTMMTSALIDQGPLHVGMVESDLATWVREMGTPRSPSSRAASACAPLRTVGVRACQLHRDAGQLHQHVPCRMGLRPVLTPCPTVRALSGGRVVRGRRARPAMGPPARVVVVVSRGGQGSGCVPRGRGRSAA